MYQGKIENIEMREMMHGDISNNIERLIKFSQRQTNSLKELLDFVLNEALECTRSNYGYVQLYDEEFKKFRNSSILQAPEGNFEFEIEKAKYDHHVTKYWKEAIQKRRPIINNNILEDYLLYGKDQVAIKIKKLLTLPVLSNDKIVAIVEVANKEIDYDDHDLKNLTLLMDMGMIIAEKTELLNKLKSSKKKTEESERLRSAFLNNISHEIRTPMNAIIGFSKLLLRSNLPEDKKEKYLSIIINSSNQLLSIVTDILTISSIDSKNEKLDLGEVNVNQLLTETEMIFKNNNVNKEIEISSTSNLNNIESFFITDKTKITQILNNLLNNAIKFTKKGDVTFGCSRKSDELLFFVKDTGLGINKDQFNKIFDRFYQVDLKSDKVYGGTGLGLSICKEFVDILHGKIWLESEQKEGTTFYFTIPLIPATPKNIDLHKKNHQSLGLTVLVAEDELSNFQLINEHLISLNCKVIYAEDGEQAIEEFTSNPDIDLILMDIKMPFMEGHIAARKIKKISPSIPIIAQTAYALPSEIKKYGPLFDGYITKPIEYDILTNTIGKYANKN